MSIKTRRFLFYSLVLLFILLGTFLVFNSRGYRLDWKNFQVEATGAIYVSSTPSKAQIELDGEKVKNESGILQEGTLIDNLLPGEYTLSIALDGYSSWEKSVEVESGSVRVFDSVILVPETEPLQLGDSLADRIVSAGKHLAVEGGGGVSLDGTLVSGHKIIALSDSGTLLTKSTATDNYYLANAFKPNENLNLTLVFNNLKIQKLDLPGAVDIKKVLPYPYNDHRFVVATNQALYLLDVDKLTLEQIAIGVNDFFIEGQNNIAWVKEGQVKLFNLPLRSETVALELGANNGPLRDLKDVSSTWLALNESGELVSLNSKSDPETIGSSVKSFSLSPKEEDIAILKQNGSLSIYNLESKISVDIDSSGVTTDTAWFKDAVHIFLLKGSTLIFAEVSNAHLENSVVLAKDVQSFSYSGGDTVSFSNSQGVFERVVID